MSLKVILSAIFVLFAVSLLFIYFLPLNTINFSSSDSNFTNPGDSSMQFYSNMRFPTSSISYNILDCSLQRRNQMQSAFDIIENVTSLTFYPVSSNEEISVTCEDKPRMEGGLFIAGEGGPTKIIVAGDFNVILEGQILLIKESNCPEPNIAIHELLHVLGFKHSSNRNNVMYNITNCNQVVGDDTIKLIKDLYSIKSYPDLSFGNVSATLSGKFLDLNMTLLNSGLAPAGSSKVLVYADDDLIKEIDVQEIDIGTGRIISVGNLFIPKLSVSKLSLVIETNFNEINKENNKKNLEITNKN